MHRNNETVSGRALQQKPGTDPEHCSSAVPEVTTLPLSVTLTKKTFIKRLLKLLWCHQRGC